MLEHGGAALFLDPGLGKTAITLAAVKILLKEGMIERVLVVAPLRVVYSVWPNEVKKWNDFSHLRCSVLHGKDKDAALASDADIYLINPEGLQWLTSIKNFKKLAADVLVIDESTRFKNMQASRFKALKPLLEKFRYRWILTGTPISNGLMDLFAQIYLIDLGRALGGFITHYRNKFFDATGFGGYAWVPKQGAEKLINKAIKPYALRLQAEDFLELPAIVDIDIVVNLPDDARNIYEQMEDDAFAVIADEEFSAAHAASAVSKCRQICNGAMYKEAGKKDWISIHTEKCQALESLLEERSGKPTMVAYEFDHDWQQIEKYFGKKFPRIGGGISGKLADKIVDEWNAGELPVLLVQPQSACHGLNMQGCEQADAIVWYAPIYDLELWDQLIRRLYRQGTKLKRLFVYRIIANKTVEFAVVRSISKKDKTQKQFLQSLKRYRTAKTAKQLQENAIGDALSKFLQ